MGFILLTRAAFNYIDISRWQGQPYLDGSKVSQQQIVRGMGIDDMNLVAALMGLTVRSWLMKPGVYVMLPPKIDTSMG